MNILVRGITIWSWCKCGTLSRYLLRLVPSAYAAIPVSLVPLVDQWTFSSIFFLFKIFFAHACYNQPFIKRSRLFRTYSNMQDLFSKIKKKLRSRSFINFSLKFLNKQKYVIGQICFHSGNINFKGNICKTPTVA